MDLLAKRRLLEQIIARHDIHPLFQPIVDLQTGGIVGVEALARGPAGSPLEYPDALFGAAAETGLLFEVDTLCAARAIDAATAHQGLLPPLVFINADPGAFTRQAPRLLQDALAGKGPYRLVLEITERALATNPAGLLQVSHQVHAAGDGLALDDVGVDPLSLAFLPLIEPDVVKFDMHLLRDPYSRDTMTTVTGVNAYAQRTGAAIIAEGIETERDLATARALGATWGQGWHFGRPGPLEALAGRRVAHQARIRPSQPDLHRVDGSPFTTAASRHTPRRVSRTMATAFGDHLLHEAAQAGRHTVVLAMDHDPAAFALWLPRMAQIAQHAGFTGVIGPAAEIPPGVHHITTTGPEGSSEATLIVVSPTSATALCLRRDGDGDDLDLVMTHDPVTALGLARMLLGRFGTRLAEHPVSTPA